MVHTVVVEDRVESVLKELLSSKQVQVGLLIGQVMIQLANQLLFS